MRSLTLAAATLLALCGSTPLVRGAGSAPKRSANEYVVVWTVRDSELLGNDGVLTLKIPVGEGQPAKGSLAVPHTKGDVEASVSWEVMAAGQQNGKVRLTVTLMTSVRHQDKCGPNAGLWSMQRSHTTVEVQLDEFLQMGGAFGNQGHWLYEIAVQRIELC
jgi:hypothetical protein